jgi:ADP-dependent NAD(P)H-hydrate dehydratase / NAD(P)H-hydrate epimerase
LFLGIDHSNAILTVDEMARADQATVERGVSGETLMANAGAAIVEAILARWQPQSLAVLCGPGNNGGDGFVVARLLREAGWDIRVGLLGDRNALKGDAKIHAERWTGDIHPILPDILSGVGLVVDALFGAGLSRPLEGMAKDTIEAIGDRACIAVDVPSGVHGDSGEVLGIAPRAALTVTFFRKKPGHLLLPGRLKCGDVTVADIGIPVDVLDGISPRNAVNGPALWWAKMPMSQPDHHKYSRGYAVISGSADMPGAAILAAMGARRAGAGMLTLTVPKESAAIYRLSQLGAVIRPVRDTGTFAEIIGDARVKAVLIGPGHGITVATRERALAALRLKKATVLDADALTVFSESRELLFSSIEGPCVFTPHDGEFRALFDHDGDKISRARLAAKESGAVILLKGADTVIASPDGRVVVNDNAPPWLATSGSGDVLAGIIVGLLAQGGDAFEAAQMASWLHGAAATAFGPGLIAEDIPEMLPSILKQLFKTQH